MLDLAANYDQLGQFVLGRIAPEFANYGLELTTILVENVSLPPEVEQRSTGAPRWAWWAISANMPSSRRPRRCARQRPVLVLPARPSA
ncbi:MAG: SPFH domain-containing protein [Geminicoccaceae bacterium]